MLNLLKWIIKDAVSCQKQDLNPIIFRTLSALCKVLKSSFVNNQEVIVFESYFDIVS